MFKNIMWATDGSDNADRALGYAVEIAEADRAELHVVHIVERYARPRAAGRAHPDEPELDARIRTRADELTAEHSFKTTLHLESGHAAHVASALARFADEDSIDLIVVGTRGRSSLAGLVLGSVTQQLLHVASCPVLTVPPAKHAPHPRRPGRRRQRPQLTSPQNPRA
jgi:nucleotide-binding universal stress UspA family protein